MLSRAPRAFVPPCFALHSSLLSRAAWVKQIGSLYAAPSSEQGMPTKPSPFTAGSVASCCSPAVENVNAAHCSQEGDGKNWESAGHPEAMLHRIHYLHRCANYQLSIARRVHRSTLLVRDDDGFQQAGIGSGVRACLS